MEDAPITGIVNFELTDKIRGCISHNSSVLVSDQSPCDHDFDLVGLYQDVQHVKIVGNRQKSFMFSDELSRDLLGRSADVDKHRAVVWYQFGDSFGNTCFPFSSENFSCSVTKILYAVANYRTTVNPLQQPSAAQLFQISSNGLGGDVKSFGKTIQPAQTLPLLQVSTPLSGADLIQ